MDSGALGYPERVLAGQLENERQGARYSRFAMGGIGCDGCPHVAINRFFKECSD